MNTQNNYPYDQLFNRSYSDLIQLNRSYQETRRRLNGILATYGEVIRQMDADHKAMTEKLEEYVSYTSDAWHDPERAKSISTTCLARQFEFATMMRTYGVVYKNYRTLQEELEAMDEQRNEFMSHYC